MPVQHLSKLFLTPYSSWRIPLGINQITMTKLNKFAEMLSARTYFFAQKLIYYVGAITIMIASVLLILKGSSFFTFVGIFILTSLLTLIICNDRNRI